MESNERAAPTPASAPSSTTETDNFDNGQNPITSATTNAGSSASVHTHSFINELLTQKPGPVTSSRSESNANVNTNTGETTAGTGNQVHKPKSKGTLTAPPSRRASLFQNLAKIYPFSSTLASPEPHPQQLHTKNSDTIVNLNPDEQQPQRQRQCSDELCILKAVAPLPVNNNAGSDGGEPPSARNSETKIPGRNESIASVILDINRKESQGHIGQESPANVNEQGNNDDGALTIVRCTDSASTEGFCRICHDNPSKMTLIAPCSCKGSMGLVHRTCLERWLGESGKQNCEICKTEFITERRPRYTGCSSIYQWIKSPLSPTDTRNLFFDLACFLVLTPLAVVSAWLCIDSKNGNILDLSGGGTANGRRRKRGFWRNAYNNDPDNTTWTSIGLLTLTGTLLAAYYVWLYVAFRYHLQIWREWQRHNYVVTIVPVAGSRSRNRDRDRDRGRDRNCVPSCSSDQPEDNGGHRSDPGTNTATPGPATAENSRERSRSLSIGRRLEKEKHRQNARGQQFRHSARIEAQRLAAATEMNSFYSLSFLNEYHALLMASVNYNEDSTSSPSFSLPSSSTSSIEAPTPTPTSQQPKFVPVPLTTTVIGTPDREVIIIEPEAQSSASLPNFPTDEELEVHVHCANCQSTTAITSGSVPEDSATAANNNENSQTVQQQHQAPASEIRT